MKMTPKPNTKCKPPGEAGLAGLGTASALPAVQPDSELEAGDTLHFISKVNKQ